MNKIEFNKYFDNTDIKFYNPRILIEILEDYLGRNIEFLKREIGNANIVITEEEIVKFLDQKFEEEEPEVRHRIKNPKLSKSKEGLIELTYISEEEIEESTEVFMDQLKSSRYKFEPYTLEYFKRYCSIVKEKATLILDIIEKIANKDSLSIQETIEKLDIQLDEFGNVSREDIIRLLTPMIYNYQTLIDKTNKGNSLDTYLTFAISKHSIYKRGLSEGEIYPNQSIYTINSYYDHLPGSICLSTRQKSKLQRSENRRIKKNAQFLVDLWD